MKNLIIYKICKKKIYIKHLRITIQHQAQIKNILFRNKKLNNFHIYEHITKLNIDAVYWRTK